MFPSSIPKALNTATLWEGILLIVSIFFCQSVGSLESIFRQPGEETLLLQITKGFVGIWRLRLSDLYFLSSNLTFIEGNIHIQGCQDFCLDQHFYTWTQISISPFWAGSFYALRVVPDVKTFLDRLVPTTAPRIFGSKIYGVKHIPKKSLKQCWRFLVESDT